MSIAGICGMVYSIILYILLRNGYTYYLLIFYFLLIIIGVLSLIYPAIRNKVHKSS